MTRILTGIQSSGKPHLGNILGAIKPSIELSKNSNGEVKDCFETINRGVFIFNEGSIAIFT